MKNKLSEQSICAFIDCALTCFQQNDLIVLTQIHEACNTFGKLHNVLDCVGNVVCALLPHPLSRLKSKVCKKEEI